MKYRICKMTNGNNRIWYTVKENKWWFWRNVRIYHAISVRQGYYKHLSFFTFDQAKEWVDREIANNKWIAKAKQEKVLECVEV